METIKPQFTNEVGREKINKYTYRDNSAGRKVIFECVANNILEADKLYEEKTGNNPEKQNHVGCSIEKIDKDLEV
jgi:hypothetical protein